MGYYFVIYLPKVNEKQFVLNEQSKCLDVGEQAYKANQQMYGIENVFEPQYGYSKKLNTCIYSGGYYNEGSPSSGVSSDIIPHNCNASWERWIKNSYTNEKILDIVNFSQSNCQWSASTDKINEFWQQSTDLFNS